MNDTSVTAGDPRRLMSEHIRTGELFKIHIVNIVLSILTLGLYRFWAKTRMRRYLWNHIEIDGDRLEYTGTAKELFIGFLLVVGVIILPLFILPNIIEFIQPMPLGVQGAIASAQLVLIYILIPFAIYRARRYRLSRTQWRGIHGAQTGTARGYTWRVILYFLVNAVTLGMTIPVFSKKLAAFRITNTWIGNEPLKFECDAGKLYPAFFAAIGMSLIAIILTTIILLIWLIALMFVAGFDVQDAKSFNPEKFEQLMGQFAWSFAAPGIAIFVILQIPLLWYNASKAKFFTLGTCFMEMGFELKMNRWRLVWLMLSNNLIALLTLTLALPYVYKRSLRFFSDRLMTVGEQNFDAILQTMDDGPSRGEGLADAFDAGGFGA